MKDASLPGQACGQVPACCIRGNECAPPPCGRPSLTAQRVRRISNTERYFDDNELHASQSLPPQFRACSWRRIWDPLPRSRPWLATTWGGPRWAIFIKISRRIAEITEIGEKASAYLHQSISGYTWLMNIVERRLTTSLSKTVNILVFWHCIIDDFYFYVIESVVLHRSLLAVPNTFMSFSPSLAV